MNMNMNINFEFNYKDYADQNNLWSLLELNRNDYENIEAKSIPNAVNHFVDPNVLESFKSEPDDLIRIHYLVRTLKVVTVLEIGAGKSTLVISDAIQKNKIEFGDYVKANLRKNNPFELHSVETSDYWAKEVEKTIPSNLKEICTIHISKCRMNIFNSRVCTSFDNLPNICPDFIYLDGPDQYSVEGDIDGITTSHPDRMPMVSDILRIEPFLLPGTVILVDGRTANARFMKNNLQQEWDYKHFFDCDIHIFINTSSALGIYNEKELNFKANN